MRRKSAGPSVDLTRSERLCKRNLDKVRGTKECQKEPPNMAKTLVESPVRIVKLLKGRTDVTVKKKLSSGFRASKKTKPVTNVESRAYSHMETDTMVGCGSVHDSDSCKVRVSDFASLEPSVGTSKTENAVLGSESSSKQGYAAKTDSTSVSVSEYESIKVNCPRGRPKGSSMLKKVQKTLCSCEDAVSPREGGQPIQMRSNSTGKTRCEHTCITQCLKDPAGMEITKKGRPCGYIADDKKSTTLYNSTTKHCEASEKSYIGGKVELISADVSSLPSLWVPETIHGSIVGAHSNTNYRSPGGAIANAEAESEGESVSDAESESEGESVSSSKSARVLATAAACGRDNMMDMNESDLFSVFNRQDSNASCDSQNTNASVTSSGCDILNETDTSHISSGSNDSLNSKYKGIDKDRVRENVTTGESMQNSKRKHGRCSGCESEGLRCSHINVSSCSSMSGSGSGSHAHHGNIGNERAHVAKYKRHIRRLRRELDRLKSRKRISKRRAGLHAKGLGPPVFHVSFFDNPLSEKHRMDLVDFLGNLLTKQKSPPRRSIPDHTVNAVCEQVQYYFSNDNLDRPDTFLLSKMVTYASSDQHRKRCKHMHASSLALGPQSPSLSNSERASESCSIALGKPGRISDKDLIALTNVKRIEKSNEHDFESKDNYGRTFSSKPYAQGVATKDDRHDPHIPSHIYQQTQICLPSTHSDPLKTGSEVDIDGHSARNVRDNFVPLKLIFSFQKVQALTRCYATFLECVSRAPMLELSDDQSHIRRVRTYDMPEANRLPTKSADLAERERKESDRYPCRLCHERESCTSGIELNTDSDTSCSDMTNINTSAKSDFRVKDSFIYYTGGLYMDVPSSAVQLANLSPRQSSKFISMGNVPSSESVGECMDSGQTWLYGRDVEYAPEYDVCTTSVLPVTGSDVNTLVREKRRCFNCGSSEHMLNECPHTRDKAKVETARAEMEERNLRNGKGGVRVRGDVRYHIPGNEKYDHFRPGFISIELREALGMLTDDIDVPPYYSNMLMWGYPPGYTCVRVDADTKATDSVFDTVLKVYDDTIEGETGDGELGGKEGRDIYYLNNDMTNGGNMDLGDSSENEELESGELSDEPTVAIQSVEKDTHTREISSNTSSSSSTYSSARIQTNIYLPTSRGGTSITTSTLQSSASADGGGNEHASKWNPDLPEFGQPTKPPHHVYEYPGLNVPLPLGFVCNDENNPYSSRYNHAMANWKYEQVLYVRQRKRYYDKLKASKSQSIRQ
eukprot:CFRG7345T1